MEPFRLSALPNCRQPQQRDRHHRRHAGAADATRGISPACYFTGIADAVAIGISLIRIGHVWAVVARVDYAVAVGIELASIRDAVVIAISAFGNVLSIADSVLVTVRIGVSGGENVVV